MWVKITESWKSPYIEIIIDSNAYVLRTYRQEQYLLCVENNGIKTEKQLSDEQFPIHKYNLLMFLENIYPIIHSLMNLSPSFYDLSTEDIPINCG